MNPAIPEIIQQQRAERVSALREQLESWFPSPGEVVLEAGCGHGHYLTAYAEIYKNAPCIGIDLRSRRIAKACEKRDKRGLSHLFFQKAELREWLEALPPGVRIHRLFMLFPDPWPKKRHHKHRMLQASSLTALAVRACPAASLHFRSDDRDNFEWALEQVDAHPSWRLAPELPWPFEHPTVFQELTGDYKSFSAIRLAGVGESA